MSQPENKLVIMSLGGDPRELLGHIAALPSPEARRDLRELMVGAAVTAHSIALDLHLRTGEPVPVPEAVVSPILLGSEGQAILARNRKQGGAQLSNGHIVVRDTL